LLGAGSIISFFCHSSNRKSKIANRKSIDEFKRLQRIGNDAGADDDLTGSAHKISGWPRKGAKRFFPAILHHALMINSVSISELLIEWHDIIDLPFMVAFLQ
jgi:hypothetical protein